MRVRQGVVFGGVVGVLAVGIGAVSAFAAVPIPGADGKIRACVKYEDINRYEQMRWITKTTCPKGEKLIAWNAKGARGEKGDKGEPGPPGAPGAPGAEGAPGGTDVHFKSEENIGYNVGYKPTTILSVTVPSGRYAVTATTEVHNFKDDPDVAACTINNFSVTRRDVVVAPHSSVVLTVIGLNQSDFGKLNLICGGLPASDEINGPRFDDPKIMATRISD